MIRISSLVVLASISFAALGQEVTVKKRSNLSQDELRKELLDVPEIGLAQPQTNLLYASIQAKGKPKGTLAGPARADLGPLFFKNISPAQFTATPWIKGVPLPAKSAERLDTLSQTFRQYMVSSRRTSGNDIIVDFKQVRKFVSEGYPREVAAKVEPKDWITVDAIPTLVQMFQAEDEDCRSLLIELLSQIKEPLATNAIASRAIFDTSASIREQAVKALARRDSMGYMQAMLQGLSWPWPAAQDHAAEALVALKTKDEVPRLIRLLKEPDPRLPVTSKGVTYVREMVRMNHLCNCMVCHAPSNSTDDKVRGVVPIPGVAIRTYYAERSGFFVRADITYLKQSFSVPQPVVDPGQWPKEQRYDYFLRSRSLTKEEVKNFKKAEKSLPESYKKREAILFALRELTGQDLGSTYESWEPLLKSYDKDQ